MSVTLLTDNAESLFFTNRFRCHNANTEWQIHVLNKPSIVGSVLGKSGRAGAQSLHNSQFGADERVILIDMRAQRTNASIHPLDLWHVLSAAPQ